MDSVQQVVLMYSSKVADIHRSNLDGGRHFCGWIPAECPFCFTIGISPVYVAPKPSFAGTPVFVLCPSCGWQFDWSDVFALLAQKPPTFVSNLEVPEAPPDWLRSEQFAGVEEALRYYLEHGSDTAPRPAPGDEETEESPAMASIRAKVRELADQQSGIHASTESEAAAEQLQAELRELTNGVPEEQVLQAIAAGTAEAYRRMPSQSEVEAAKKMLLAKMIELTRPYRRPASRKGARRRVRKRRGPSPA